MWDPSRPFDIVAHPRAYTCACGAAIPEEATHVVAARLTGRTAFLNNRHYCDAECFIAHVENEARRTDSGLEAIELRELVKRLR
jgi:hypothetical protein